MSGTWETQNKVLPGAYINIRTNEPLSVTPGERGTVVIIQEMSKGVDKTIYKLSAGESNLPEGVTQEDTKLAEEALKNAMTVFLYKLPQSHTKADAEEAFEVIKTLKWNTLCYPYDREEHGEVKAAVASFIRSMREEEGMKCQAVLANHSGNYEGIINVVQSIVLSDGEILSPEEVTAWTAGITAGAGLTTSNTGVAYKGAVDVSPRMTKTEMETAVQDGKFIFKVDSAQNVTVVYDINSLTEVTEEKGEQFKKNRVIRTLDGMANDIAAIFEGNFIGRTNNSADGRTLLRAALVDYMTALQNLGAIKNFTAEDVTVETGDSSDAVVADVAAQPVDSVEKIYMTINLS